MLIDPLANGIAGAAGALKQPIHAQVDYGRKLCLGDDATSNALETLHADKPPALLFTASHGMAMPSGSQIATQGALLCQDWPSFGSVHPEHLLAAADIADDANVSGLVAFCSPVSAMVRPTGPVPDGPVAGGEGAAVGAEPFVAALPRRLLSHPNGSALAVIGHIDRAWGFSIQSPNDGPQIGPFRNSLGFILNGAPVGYALAAIRRAFRGAFGSAPQLGLTDRSGRDAAERPRPRHLLASAQRRAELRAARRPGRAHPQGRPRLSAYWEAGRANSQGGSWTELF